MPVYRWQGNNRFLLVIFFIASCSLPLAIGLQSRRFDSCHSDRRVLGFCGRSSTQYSLLRGKGKVEKDFVEDGLFGPSHTALNTEKDSRRRRDLILSTGISFFGLAGIYRSDPAEAINAFEKKGLYVLNTRDAQSAATLSNEQVGVFPKLSSEYALLRVLPVKNTIFRTVEQNLESLSVLRYRRETSNENIDKAWARADSSVDTALTILTNKRNQLEPVFNPDDSTEVAKLKKDRGEKLLGDLSQDLEYLKQAIANRVGSTACTTRIFSFVFLSANIHFAFNYSEYHVRLSKTTEWFAHLGIPGGVACKEVSLQSALQR